ncbi:MAG: tetratricopeptide repeat protein [Bacteroidetes bacterium]|nr:tetratricopeptide repeat protein [Bacteroidota bacterium]MBU1679632.1 tetratricopeptide repeat protein [Bacteroidota bacterium]MBU2508503.1 tetratricopeptide repeat protein [Bacteroidota bacterium]
MNKHLKHILVFIVFFLAASQIFSASNDDKLKAFSESISYEEIGNYNKAFEIINSYYKKDSDDYLTTLRLGWLKYLQKDYNESIKYYNKAVKLSSESIESLLGITYPYSALNKWDEIKAVYKKILKKDEYNYTANLNLGQIYLNTQDYLNARSYLENVYNNYPSDLSANVYLGWTYYYLGNKTKANYLFTNALISDKTNSSAIEGLNLTR